MDAQGLVRFLLLTSLVWLTLHLEFIGHEMRRR